MPSSCCPVCYKVGGSSASEAPGEFGGGGGHDPVAAGAQQRFFKLIQSFSLGQVGADENGKDGDGAVGGGGGQQKFPFPLEQFEKFGMICCGECSKIMKGVCERHHQLETAQLSLNRKLEKLKRIMTEAQGSSTRLGEHLKVTENEGAGDDMMGAVLESRASLLAICSRKVTCSLPKPDIPGMEFHEEAFSVLETLPRHVGGALDLSENLDLLEDGGSDLDEAQPVKRRRCESPRPPFGDGTGDRKRKGTNCTLSEEEEAASTSTDTGTPRTIARERNNESPSTSSAGHAETAPSELNVIGNAKMDPNDPKSTMDVVLVEVDLDESHYDDRSENSWEDWEEETQLELERSIKELYRKEEDSEEDDPHQHGDPPMSEVMKQELMSKLEEARQKKADLERMARRMAWKSEVQRTIAGNAEFKEIMEEVPLEEVEVDEKPRMSRMSMEWREAFKSKRANFLFPEVISALLESTLANFWDPQFVDYRLVCKSAKESVDALLTSNRFCPLWRIQPDHAFSNIGDQYSTMRISDFNTVLGPPAQTFSKDFEHAVNPFFTRTIDIITPSRIFSNFRVAEFLKDMEGILRRWGKGLWSAFLHFQDDKSVEFIYDILVAWLKLMPNLRFLKFAVADRLTADIDDSKLREHMAMNPFPEMPHLAQISTDSSMPTTLIQAIFHKFESRLERILLDNFDNTCVGFGPFPPAPAHLGVTLVLCVFETVFNSVPPPLAGGSFSGLRQMQVSYSNLGNVSRLRSIFNNFNLWRLPLKRLELLLYGFGEIVELNEVLTCKGIFLDMPQLEEFHLSLYYGLNLESLDFLLPCKALKEIVLCTETKEINMATGFSKLASQSALQRPKPPGTGIFQFTTDEVDKDHIYESRLWKLLPDLKRIKLITYRDVHMERHRFTREEYLQRLRLERKLK